MLVNVGVSQPRNLRRLLNHLIMLCKKRPEPSKDYEWIAKTQDMPTKIFGGFLFNDIYPFSKNPKILGLHLSSFGPILYPHAQAFEGFVSSHGFSTDTDFELKFGVARSDEKPTPLSGHGWHFWPGGGVDILPGLAPQVIGDKGRKVTKQPSIRMELMFFHKVTMLQCYNFVGNRKRIWSKREYFRDGICCHLDPSEVR